MSKHKANRGGLVTAVERARASLARRRRCRPAANTGATPWLDGRAGRPGRALRCQWASLPSVDRSSRGQPSRLASRRYRVAKWIFG